MACTAPNMLSLSSCSSFSLSNRGCHLPIISLTFHTPKTKTPNISIPRMAGGGYSHRSFNFHVDPTKKPLMVDRDLMAVRATEVIAPTSEETPSKSRKSNTSKKGKDAKYPRKMLDVYQILQYPIITEAAIKNIPKENSLIFTVDVRADKTMIKDAINNFFDVKVRKVNTLIRPDGTKKAYVMLSREYNASDIAKRIGIFPK